ncbi:MAG: hypothetical protein RSD90_04815, partial [Anaerovoracaceae bacterium]
LKIPRILGNPKYSGDFSQYCHKERLKNGNMPDNCSDIYNIWKIKCQYFKKLTALPIYSIENPPKNSEIKEFGGLS